MNIYRKAVLSFSSYLCCKSAIQVSSTQTVTICMYKKVAFCLQHRVFLSSVLILITFAQPVDISHPHGNHNLILIKIHSTLFYISAWHDLITSYTYIFIITNFVFQNTILYWNLSSFTFIWLILNQYYILLITVSAFLITSGTVIPWHVSIVISIVQYIAHTFQCDDQVIEMYIISKPSDNRSLGWTFWQLQPVAFYTA